MQIDIGVELVLLVAQSHHGLRRKVSRAVSPGALGFSSTRVDAACSARTSPHMRQVIASGARSIDSLTFGGKFRSSTQAFLSGGRAGFSVEC